MAVASQHVLVRGQPVGREGAAHVQLLRRDAYLGAEAEHAAVREGRRGVRVDRRRVDARARRLIRQRIQFHQPLVACTLIGLVTGHLQEGILLGGSLQMMALGWANVGAAVAPDAALASVASSIIMVLALNGGATDSAKAVTTAIAVAVPLSVAGLFLTMICRTIATAIAHAMDGCAEKGDFSGIERWQYAAILMQGLRIAIPAVLLCVIPAEAVTNALNAMPDWLSGGMAVGGGMVASVGYAMVINMMATKETWPFFILGFVLAAIPQLTLIALGLIGISLALIYLGLKDLAKQGGGMGGGSGDPLGDILNDYE